MGICENCGRECIKHAKGMCVTCYKRLIWKPKKQECKRCKRTRPHHAKGYCNGCYNSVFHMENAKDWNYRRNHNISAEKYRELTKRCIICGFNKYVVLHHLDENHKNSTEDNLIGLCPNHHQLVHTLKYRDEIKKQINEIKQKSEKIPTKEENSSE